MAHVTRLITLEPVPAIVPLHALDPTENCHPVYESSVFPSSESPKKKPTKRGVLPWWKNNMIK